MLNTQFNSRNLINSRVEHRQDEKLSTIQPKYYIQPREYQLIIILDQCDILPLVLYKLIAEYAAKLDVRHSPQRPTDHLLVELHETTRHRHIGVRFDGRRPKFPGHLSLCRNSDRPAHSVSSHHGTPKRREPSS